MNGGWKRSLMAGAIIAPLLAACGDAPTEPMPAPRLVRQFYYGDEQVEVVERSYVMRGARAKRTIGRGGGEISVNGITLVVPAGALDRRVEIVMSTAQGKHLNVELEPHGLVFNIPARLSFSLAGTNFNAVSADSLSGAYHTDGLQAETVTPREVMSVTTAERMVTFGVWHFSDYALTKLRKGLILVGG